ncbi:MAG: tetratricopeptide repeat protein [Myxococcales bacterium]|nr:tetratricopeptide repeat protein [Myxococcales bacterium]
MKITHVALWVCLLSVGLWPLRAASASDFKTHYELAMALYQAQKFEAAIPEFKAAHEREAKPGLLFNIAQCYRKAGHPREAIEYYDRYLSSEPRLDNEMRKKVDGYLAEARNTLAALELEMKQRLAEEKAMREREREPAPSALVPAAPTEATQVERAPAIELSAAAPRRESPTPAKPIYTRWWFWTAIGGGVLAAAVITGVAVGSKSTGYPAVPTGVPRVVLMF